MYVVKFSVGLRATRRWTPDGAFRISMIWVAKMNENAVVTSTAKAATMRRLRNSPRCCMSESSLSRSFGVWVTAQG